MRTLLIILFSLLTNVLMARDVQIVFIGNSITQGATLRDAANEGPASQTRNLLQDQGYSVNILNRGLSGTTTYDWLPDGKSRCFAPMTQATDAFFTPGATHLFSVMLGTNDSAETTCNGSPVSASQYETNMRQIIDALLQRYPDARILVNYPIWYSPTTHNGAKYLQSGLDRLQTYYPIIDRLAQAYPNRVFAGNREVFQAFEGKKEFFTEEQGHQGAFYLHPNAQGARHLATYWAASLKPLVQHHTAYLFSYFVGQNDGLHLAYSYDGLQWTALNDNRSVLRPEIGKDRLMRDPSICQGPDGTFHMVWTSSWTDRIIAHASSPDLIHWSQQDSIPVMMHEPKAENCWAPELYYDEATHQYYIFWATTIKGAKGIKTEGCLSENGSNHRIYCTTTRDFKTFSKTRLWFNPDFNAIDAAVVKSPINGDLIMAVKNENLEPYQKNIRITRSRTMKSFPIEVSEPIHKGRGEGPAPLFVGQTLYVYYDIYGMHRYGVSASTDNGYTWQDRTAELSLPQGIRHGTAFAVDAEVVEQLIRHYGTDNSVNYGSFNIRYANGDRKDPERCWNVRRDRVAAFICDHELGIVGCQEVLHEQLLDLQRLLPQYDYEGVGRDDGKTEGEYSPIFWRRDQWQRLKGGTFWLSENPDEVGKKGWDAVLPRIATWVLLQNRQTGRQLMCINTHFDHVGTQARVESGKLILRKAREIAGKTPLVLTGDFNVDMTSPVYQTITHDPSYTILDTYLQGAPHEGVYYTWHDFGRVAPDRAGKIDFIFASPQIKVLSTLIQPDDRSEHPQHLSDHNPVVSRLLVP